MSLVKIGNETFLKAENNMINLRNVKGIYEDGKCIYFYFGIFNTAQICNKEGYNMVKQVLWCTR